KASIPDLFTDRQAFLVELYSLVEESLFIIGKANTIQRTHLSLLVSGLFKKSETLLVAFHGLSRAVLTPVDRPKIKRRIAQSQPISAPFRNTDRELIDSQRLSIIAFLDNRIGQFSQRG